MVERFSSKKELYCLNSLTLLETSTLKEKSSDVEAELDDQKIKRSKRLDLESKSGISRPVRSTPELEDK